MTPPPEGKVRKFAVMALLMAAIAAVLWTTSASGAQKGGRTVVLKTSVTTIGPNGRATVTATVRPGSLVPPGGSVKFINRTTGKTLGTALLRARSGGPCTAQARSCQAKLTVSGHSLVRGANRIIGLFNPRRLYYPTFRGGTWLYRGVSPGCHATAPGATQPVFTASPLAHTAARRGSLCRGQVRDPHGGVVVTVSSENRVVVTRQTLIAFGSQTLPCSSSDTGDLLAFSISGAQAPGSLAYEVLGRAANVARRAHPKGFICYESTIPFRTDSGARAKRTANGSYYGSLPHCRDNDGDDLYPFHPNGDDQPQHPAPCIEWQKFSIRHGQAVWTTWVQPTTGDPRLAH